MGRLRRGGEFTGLMVSPFLGRKPSKRERQLGAWADSRGLYIWIHEAKQEGTLYELGIEERIEGTLHAYAISLPSSLNRLMWPELRTSYERILRAGFERYKDDKARFPWWEHVQR